MENERCQATEEFCRYLDSIASVVKSYIRRDMEVRVQDAKIILHWESMMDHYQDRQKFDLIFHEQITRLMYDESKIIGHAEFSLDCSSSSISCKFPTIQTPPTCHCPLMNPTFRFSPEVLSSPGLPELSSLRLSTPCLRRRLCLLPLPFLPESLSEVSHHPAVVTFRPSSNNIHLSPVLFFKFAAAHVAQLHRHFRSRITITGQGGAIFF